MRLIIDDRIPYIRGLAEQLGQTTYLPGAAIGPTDVATADALIIRTRTRADAALLAGSSVRFVATATIGFDHIDTKYLAQAGIGWANCPGCNATSVAQYVSSALLVLQRTHRLPAGPLVVGIVGVGHVGSAVAQTLRADGHHLLLCDPPRAEQEPEAAQTFVPLERVAREADVITFHTPLTYAGPHATFHLADAAFFHSLSRRPAIINAARGEVVDTAALIAAIDEGRVGPAVIDTWEGEPHPSPELLRRVALGTPHIAGYSADGKANGTRMALEAVAHFFGRNCHFDVRPPRIEGIEPALDPVERRLQLYDPRRDSDALRQHPDRFEELRGHYPLRREHFGD